MAELKELFDWSFFDNPAWRWMVAGAYALLLVAMAALYGGYWMAI